QGSGPQAWRPLEYSSVGADYPFIKWKTGGTVFGIITIVIGSISGCMGVFIPFTMLLPQAANQKLGAVITATLLYVGIAVALIWLGAGAVKMRRWVRPIVLIFGLLSIILGVFFFVSMGLMYSVSAKGSQTNPAVLGTPGAPYPVFVAMTMLFFGFLFVAIPGVYVWFYRKPEVKAALEHFDPAPRWTDRCPIPALAIVMVLMCYAVMTLVAIPQAIMPVFGTVLHGPFAMVLQLILVVVAIILAKLAFQCRPSGWWGTTGLLILLMIAYAMTSLRSDQPAMYRAAGFDAQQVELMSRMQSSRPFGFLIIQLISTLLMLGYLAYVRKYFNGPNREAMAIGSPAA
ncbi:MAG TPA: hypothetical protein VGG44_03225, partial [Tepidisphaeraceae bacterium]